jgi:hypothetical protein
MPQIIPEFGGISAHMRLRMDAGVRLSALDGRAVLKKIARFADRNEVARLRRVSLGNPGENDEEK